IGVPYWGRGLVPEAVREVLRHAFDDLGVTKVWCGYYDGNVKSKRAQEKCGFKYSHTIEDAFVPQMNERRKAYIMSIKKEDRD
ncbi:MAG: GNAT family N-acetyltransferase, partial [Clostridia bacterium]|nr:GNAT family N-acetyltransferase [Clostridia bacterium]